MAIVHNRNYDQVEVIRQINRLNKNYNPKIRARINSIWKQNKEPIMTYEAFLSPEKAFPTLKDVHMTPVIGFRAEKNFQESLYSNSLYSSECDQVRTPSVLSPEILPIET